MNMAEILLILFICTYCHGLDIDQTFNNSNFPPKKLRKQDEEEKRQFDIARKMGRLGCKGHITILEMIV